MVNSNLGYLIHLNNPTNRINTHTMRYQVKIGDKPYFRTNDKQQALAAVAKVLNKGHGDVYLHGGRIGKWWSE
jgi:hypothetical protein